jgi:hypothetical protein
MNWYPDTDMERILETKSMKWFHRADIEVAGSMWQLADAGCRVGEIFHCFAWRYGFGSTAGWVA